MFFFRCCQGIYRDLGKPQKAFVSMVDVQIWTPDVVNTKL
jgi:hypothetical protein